MLGEGLIGNIPTQSIMGAIQMYQLRDTKLAYIIIKYLDDIVVDLVNSPIQKSLKTRNKKLAQGNH